MSQQPNQNQPPTSTLAIVALVFSFLCPPIGFILAIVAMIRISSSKGALGGNTLAIIALCVNFMVVPIVGILAAIAIPNFIQFQCRSKQSEAKGNLKALYVAEESFRAEKDKYSLSASEIEFTPRGQTIRYTYTITSATDSSFAAEARGTGEMAGDVWTISEKNDLLNTENGCRR